MGKLNWLLSDFTIDNLTTVHYEIVPFTDRRQDQFRTEC